MADTKGLTRMIEEKKDETTEKTEEEERTKFEYYESTCHGY